MGEPLFDFKSGGGDSQFGFEPRFPKIKILSLYIFLPIGEDL